MKYELLIEKKKIIVYAEIKGINDVREFKFILDTGSTKTIIDEQIAAVLGSDLKILKTGDKLMTVGGSTYSKVLQLPKLSLFGKEMINFEVNVLNLSPQILYFADGLIGMDFLLQFQNIKLDFEKKIIEI
jgi:predicted aspartyl protease